jgi:hypothetical protein
MLKKISICLQRNYFVFFFCFFHIHPSDGFVVQDSYYPAEDPLMVTHAAGRKSKFLKTPF